MMHRWVISCEHGGNSIPAVYADFFCDATSLLETHRGWDPGALDIYKELAMIADFAQFSTVSRLLVELNRSLHHKNLFSQFSINIPLSQRKEILLTYYFPYRNKLEDKIREYVSKGESVIHISVHSFTPQLNGQTRNADIGLLYDPGRIAEKKFCNEWRGQINTLDPALKLRMNYPYKGTADGFTTYLRKKFPEKYCGIELEVNQKHAYSGEVKSVIAKSLYELKCMYFGETM